MTRARCGQLARSLFRAISIAAWISLSSVLLSGTRVSAQEAAPADPIAIEEAESGLSPAVVEPPPMQSEQEISRLVDPFRAFEVGSLELKGIPDELDADEIKSGLALNPTRKLFTKDKPAIYASNLGEDIARVRLYLARQGYPRNQVLAQVEKDDDKEVKVRLQVEPGSPVRLVGVEVTGVPPDRARDLRDEVKLEMGKPLVDREVQSSSAWVRSWLEHRGHARAQVQTELVSVGLDSVMVRLVATPGPIYFFDDLLIEGTRTDLTPLARKTAGIESGTRYSPSVIAQAHDQLRLLDLFRQIRIYPAFSDSVPPGEAQALDVAVARADTTAVVATAPREDMSGTPIPPDSLSTPVEPADSTVLGSATDERELDLRVELSNIDPRTLETGLGYWTDDFIIAHLSWRHRNLFGGGRGFRARGFYSLHRQEVTGAVWWPALIGARTRGGRRDPHGRSRGVRAERWICHRVFLGRPPRRLQ